MYHNWCSQIFWDICMGLRWRTTQHKNYRRPVLIWKSSWKSGGIALGIQNATSNQYLHYWIPLWDQSDSSYILTFVWCYNYLPYPCETCICNIVQCLFQHAYLRLFWDLSWTTQPKRFVRVRLRQFLLQYSFSGITSGNSLSWMEEIKLTCKSSGLQPFWSLPVCGLLEALEPAEELYSGMASLCANWLPSGY